MHGKFNFNEPVTFELSISDQTFVNEHRFFLIEKLYIAASEGKITLFNSDASKIASPYVLQLETRPVSLMSPQRLAQILSAKQTAESPWETSERLRKRNIIDDEPKSKFWWALMSLIPKSDLHFFCENEGIFLDFDIDSEDFTTSPLIDSPSNQQEHALSACTKTSANDIPGNPARTAMGKLAIQFAWEIEQGQRKFVTKEQVMDRLIESFSLGEKSCIVEVGKNCVYWEPEYNAAGDRKRFDLELTYKALDRWYKSRSIHSWRQ